MNLVNTRIERLADAQPKLDDLLLGDNLTLHPIMHTANDGRAA
jgi:hypothetical protein